MVEVSHGATSVSARATVEVSAGATTMPAGDEILGGGVCPDTLCEGQKGGGNVAESGGGVSRTHGESDGGGADGNDDNAGDGRSDGNVLI